MNAKADLMLQAPTRVISEEQIEEYERAGAVCLRSLFDAPWIERMREAIEAVMVEAQETAAAGRGRGSTHFSYTRYLMWRDLPQFGDFVFHSPAASIAREMMRARRVRFYFDQLFVKEPGMLAPSPWHHDLPFWPVSGDKVCSIWLALDKVTVQSSGLEYVAGSHRWGRMFGPPNGGDRMPGFAADDKMPDIDADRSSYEFLNWDMEPGDCLVHHGLTIHGAGGNSTLDIRRRALATRWLGEDVVYRAGGGDPALVVPGLRTGDPLPADIFPWVDAD